LRIKGSPVYEYHRKTYGDDYPYEDFAPVFNEQSQQWDPDEWADLFAQAGARYIVLVTKHHDGFLLWDSQYPNPYIPTYRTTRDVTGELTHSVTAKGMKMGLYYSSILDWTFSSKPILGFADLLSSKPASQVYRQYVENHWKELIDRYNPAILWSDIGYPPDGDLPELFAYFYNRNPEGVVNDRWFQLPKYYANLLGRLFLRFFAERIMNGGDTALPQVPHCDYRTTEYATLESLPPYKWEANRGIGNSFTYNQFEQPTDYLKAADLIRMLVDIVSKNGNLLLNVGPRPDGSIPEPQRKALRGIGRWLSINGEAIYGTKPWLRAGEETGDGLVVRYTARDGFLYITILNPPQGPFKLPDLPVKDESKLIMLENNQPVDWRREAGAIQVLFPTIPDWEAIPVLRVELQ
jgi:alpha-L-fucosidase